MKKSIAFYFPYREVSGCPVLFFNIAKYLSDNCDNRYEVCIVDFTDGYMASCINEETLIRKILFENGSPCIIDADFLVMQALLPSVMNPRLQISKHTRILYWVLHPMNFLPIVFPLNFFRSFIENHLGLYGTILETFYPSTLKNTRAFISLIEKGHALCFNTPAYVPTTNQIIKRNLSNLSILQVASSDGKKKDHIALSEIIHVCWVGRLCDFKIHILNYTLSVISFYAMTHKQHILFHIVGDGECRNKLKEIHNEYFGITIEGTISKDKLDDFLLDHVDLNFAMGVSAIESAKLGIPTVILDASYQEIKMRYKFKWFHNNKDFDIGHMINEEDYEAEDDSIERIFSDLISDPQKYSDLAYGYYRDNYSLSVVTKKLLSLLNEVELTWKDVPENLRKKDITRKIYEIYKYRIR